MPGDARRGGKPSLAVWGLLVFPPLKEGRDGEPKPVRERPEGVRPDPVASRVPEFALLLKRGVMLNGETERHRERHHPERAEGRRRALRGEGSASGEGGEEWRDFFS